MAIKYNGQDLQKRMYNGQEVQKVMYNGNQIWGGSTPPVPTNDYLRLTALYADGRAELVKYGNPTNVEIQVSWDGIDWMDYTFGDFIWINEGYTLHWRNKSESVTGFSTSYSNCYKLNCGGFGEEPTTRIKVEGDINYMLCKNSVTNLIPNLHEYAFYLFLEENPFMISAPKLPSNYAPDYCYYGMFRDNPRLIEPPQLPATIVGKSSYEEMFYRCTQLIKLPQLPATIVGERSYEVMFWGCSNIKLSERQTGEYQTPYRIPTTGIIGSEPFDLLSYMFFNTGGDFTGTPNINQTYYTSNQVI